MGVTAQALHGAKVCLIPRPENNYQPLLLRRASLLATSGLIVSAKVLAIGLALLLPATAELSTITTARILQMTNEERTQNGLGTLQENASLSKAAAGKAKDIIDNDYFAHISPTGVTPWFWIQQEGYSYSVAGENLAIDFVQAEDVVSAWMASPGHRANILQPDYTETGVAVLTGEYQGGTSTIVVHMFGLPSGAARPSQSLLAARAPAETEPTSALTPSQSPVPTTVPEIVKRTPATPEVKLLGDKYAFRNSVELIIAGDVGSSVKITVDDKEVSTVTIQAGGYLMHKVDLSTFADGKLQISAYAVSKDGLNSEKVTPIKISKDTTGPAISKEELLFIIGPATDSPQILMSVPEGEYAKLSVKQGETNLVSITSPLPKSIAFAINNEPIEVSAFDKLGNAGITGGIDLLPTISSARDANYETQVHKYNGAARRLVLVIGSILVIMLLLAVLINIRIQHPRMVTHASLVILLAVVLLFI